MAQTIGLGGGSPPRVDFVAESERCPSCGDRQRVYKSRTRIVVTLAQGAFEAREVLKHCGNRGCRVAVSTSLSGIVPSGQRHGWDVITHVGMARYLRGMQREEIRLELRENHRIRMSDGTVSNLCDRFLVAFGALHEQRVPALKAAMAEGYWLHIDATCDRGKGGLFVCLDGWRGWVLLAARIPSENGETLRPLVAKTVAMFGDPIATVRDLGDAGGKAVAPLRERGITDLLCHFHFLAAVGGKLFDKPYMRLRSRLRTLRVKGDLCGVLAELHRYRRTSGYAGRFGRGEVCKELISAVLWAVDDDGRKPPTYPFSLPLLDCVRRCQEAPDRARRWVPNPRSDVENAVIRYLNRLASSLRRDQAITNAVQQLEESWAPFCELRDVLRLSNSDLSLHQDSHVKQATLPDLELVLLHQIEDALTQHGIDLRKQQPTVGKRDSRFCPQSIIVDYLNRYGPQLVGHPALRDESGRALAVVDRTNNVAECFFSQAKQSLRRRVGRAVLGRDMEQQPAQVALVRNLLKPDYVRVLCGSLEDLPRALAEVYSALPETPQLVRSNRNTEVLSTLRSLLQYDQQSLRHLPSGPDLPPPPNSRLRHSSPLDNVDGAPSNNPQQLPARDPATSTQTASPAP